MGDEVVLKGKANETVEKRKEGVITAEAQSVNRLPDWDGFAQENCTLDCTFSSNRCARFPDRGLQSNVCVLFCFFILVFAIWRCVSDSTASGLFFFPGF